MSEYIYNDEDNAPMNDFDRDGHNPTVYTSWDEMKAAELPLPFTDPPENGCWNCLNYDGNFCTLLWNNLDECYKDTERDLREPSDHCDEFELDESIKAEEFF